MIIAEGTNIESLLQYDNIFTKGTKGELRLYLKDEISQEQVQQFQNEISIGNVHLLESIGYVSKVMVIKFEKGIDTFLIIAGTAGLLGMSIVGWQLFKKVISVVSLLVVGGLTYLFLRRKKWLGS